MWGSFFVVNYQMTYIKNILSKWFSVDLRVLGIYRMVLGMIGLIDVCRRYSLIDVFYSSEAINLKSSSTIFTPKYFTLLTSFRSTFELEIFFIITAVAFVGVIVGYKTKLCQYISAIGLISIHNYLIMLENGGDQVMNCMLIWSLFLPLGKAFSIDSLINSLSCYKENNYNDLNSYQPIKSKRFWHLAYFACLLQLVLIYLFNFINKTGDMWSDGTAVFYMYQLDTFLTPFGEFIAKNLSSTLVLLLTKSTILIEVLSPILILFPIGSKWLRRIAFVVYVIFHLIIDLSIYIGLFSWIMIAALILLLDTDDILFLKRILKRFSKSKFIIFYDKDCGFCHFIARLFTRLDLFNNFTWANQDWNEKSPKNIKKMLKTTIVAFDPASNMHWTRHKAFSKIIGSLPFGFLVAWIFRIPFLEKIFGWAYDFISRNRSKISSISGLPQCGIEFKTSENKITNNLIVNPLLKIVRSTTFVFSNIFVLLLIIGSIDYALQANEGLEDRIPKFKEIKRKISPKRESHRYKLKNLVLYPRMVQRWNMFSPTVLRTEKWITADITFMDNSKLSLFQKNDDIYNQFNLRYFDYKDQFWRKFFSRLNKKQNKKYIKDFKNWLYKTNYFSKYNNKRVKSVKLWYLTETSPKISDLISDRKKVRKRELKSQRSSNKTPSKFNKRSTKQNRGSGDRIKPQIRK